VTNNHSSQSESEITLGLLRAVHEDEKLTQRSAASELGVALGLVNTYLKRCVRKGFIKIRQIPRNRYAYYLTPQGFAEKSRLTAEFLSQSLSLFRQAQGQYREILKTCAANGWDRIVLYGWSDLSEIAALCALEHPLTITAVVAPDGAGGVGDIPTVRSLDEAGAFDAVILTDLNDPQGAFDVLAGQVAVSRILTPPFLEIARTRPRLAE